MNIFASWGMGGLIKSNLRVYFDSINDGIDHENALMIVLKSRYPFEPGKIIDVSSLWEGAMRFEANARKAKLLPAKDQLYYLLRSCRDADNLLDKNLLTPKDELYNLIRTMYEVETHLDRADGFARIKKIGEFDDKFNELYDKMRYGLRDNLHLRTMEKAETGIVQEEYVKNTSGQGKLSVIPKEIRGWNWGAFFFGWIWGSFNLGDLKADRLALVKSTRYWFSVLTLIPYLGLIAMVVLGIKGNEWAWQGKKWDNGDHFKRSQRRWAWWALGIFIFGLLFYIWLGMLQN